MIQPERSRPLWKWDIMCALLLILVAVLTPFEAGFLEGEVNSFVGIFNIITNVFFAADMCMQFFIAYPIETSAPGVSLLFRVMRIWPEMGQPQEAHCHPLPSGLVPHRSVPWSYRESINQVISGGF